MGTTLVIFILAIHVIHLHAGTEADDVMAEKFLNTMLECFNKSGLSDDDLANMQQTNLLDSEKKRCMYACAYKAVGMMDAKGMLDVENLKKLTKEAYGDNQEAMQETLEFIQFCKSVNDEPVSDGEKGCDRAALMFKCSQEHAPKLP